MTNVKITHEDFKNWIPNIRVTIWGNPLKCEKPDNCPLLEQKRCVDGIEECPYFMGHEVVKSPKYWGDELKACCGLLLKEERK